jgi:Tol biopolymer transport system component
MSGTCGNIDPCTTTGGRIAFVSNRDGDRDVYVSFADGSAPNLVTHNGVDDFEPLWSPDGSQIAFRSDGDVFVVGTDGNGLKNVSNTSDLEQHAAWSPDGSMIAFDSIHSGVSSVFVVTNAGDTVTTVASTGQPSNDTPAWAPDGSKLVFVSGTSPAADSGVWNVALTVGATPGSLFMATAADADGSPRWSADGSKIAFISSHDGNPDIWIMNPNGSGAEDLTNSPDAETELSWSPDSKTIAFVRTSADSSDVWVIHADGTGATNLTQSTRHNGRRTAASSCSRPTATVITKST